MSDLYPLPKLEDLKSIFQRPRYINLLKLQLVKDLFVLTQEVNSIEECTSLECLYHSLISLFNEHISNNNKGVMNLLYRADVSEHQIRQALKSNPEKSNEVLAALILRREAQKILLREKYSR